MSHLPRSHTASVTAGLKWPPEMCPPAKIITMSDAPMASGVSGLPLCTAMPTVKTRKNVPMNSTMYFFIRKWLAVGMEKRGTEGNAALRA